MAKALAVWEDRDVKRLKLRDVRYKVAEPALRGTGRLVVEVFPSGLKAFHYQYFHAGVRKQVKLGNYRTDPTVKGITLADAREKARVESNRVRDLVRDGRNPADQRREQRKAERNRKLRTLGDFIKNRYEEFAQSNIANHTDHLRVLRVEFGHLSRKDMLAITSGDVESWRKKKSDVAFETKRRAVTYLKACLARAVKFGVIDRSPLSGYMLSERTNDERVTEEKTRFLSKVEEQRLRSALDKIHATQGEHIKPLVLLALLTGLRRGDLFTLRWEEVDLDLGQIRKVIGKSSHAHRKAGKPPKTAVLPLADEAKRILTDWRNVLFPSSPEAAHGLVFASPVTGGQLTSIKTAWDRLQRDADIPDVRFHDLRHSYASRLVMAGVDLNTVRELMTHASITMTLRYAHLAPEHKAAAVARAFPSLGATP